MKETKLLSTNEYDLETAALLLKKGEIGAIPTETVYGLAADATNEKAVSKIFEVKGRPSDNPLIVHVSDSSMINLFAEDIPSTVYKLANKFWPGPLTIVLHKKNIIPSIVTAGLDTIALRVPANDATRKLISLCGKPLAAPSANLSGYPSPTTAKHVLKDLDGKISAIVDGGPCTIGLESTVIMFESFDSIRVLRPGAITVEDLKTIVDDVIIDKSVLSDKPADEKALSPGMKHKHYSPKAKIILVRAGLERFTKYVEELNIENSYALIFDYDSKDYPYKHLTYGDNYKEQAQQVFSKLREIDDMGIETVFVRAPRKEGIGLAVYNRLIRAAGFEVIER